MAAAMDTLLEELARGNAQVAIEEREILLGYIRGQPDFQQLSSYLLGGQTGQGKSQVAAHLCCMSVLASGLLWVIDPHEHELRRGLLPKIEPLRSWFANDPFSLDFLEDLPGIVNEFEQAYQEYKRRKAKGGMLGKKPLFLVVDELNELLGDIRLELGVKEATRVGQIVANFSRGGAKYGCYVLIMGHNWQMSKSGGSDVRPNIRGRIALFCDSIQLVLNRDKEELKPLLKQPLHPGTGIVLRPQQGLCRMKFPLTERQDCEAVAALMHHIEGKPEYSAHSGHSDTKTLLPLPLSESEHTQQQRRLLEPIQGSTTFRNNTHHPLETYLNTLNTHLNITITLEELTKITQEGNKLIQQNGKVTRTAIMRNLGWNRCQYQRLIMPVCDLLGWHRSMDKQWTTEDWQRMKEQYNFTCRKCGRQEPDILLEPDHITPQVKGGTTETSNIQPLCKSCNSSKRETKVGIPTHDDVTGTE